MALPALGTVSEVVKEGEERLCLLLAVVLGFLLSVLTAPPLQLLLLLRWAGRSRRTRL